MSYCRDVGCFNWSLSRFRSSYPEAFCENGVFGNFAKFIGKFLCQSLFFLKKRTLAKVFSSEFCKIFKNTFFIEHLWWLLLSFTYWSREAFLAFIFVCVYIVVTADEANKYQELQNPLTILPPWYRRRYYPRLPYYRRRYYPRPYYRRRYYPRPYYRRRSYLTWVFWRRWLRVDV